MCLGGFENIEVAVGFSSGLVLCRGINEDLASKYIGGRGL
jgi:aldehyde:ferredoxin oxidoreductase